MTVPEVVPSHLQDIIDIFRAEPDRVFTIKDFVDLTGKSNDAIRQVLSRLASNGDFSGPIKRIDQGLYKYDQTREDPNVLALMKYGYWRIENLRLIKRGSQGVSEGEKSALPAVSKNDFQNNQRVRPGFPQTSATGQKIIWLDYSNGTQEIRLSANKKGPFSPDNVLTILKQLEASGFDPKTWVCISIETNIEGRYQRCDASLSVMLLQGILLKVYQHGGSTRIELADRREWPVPEIIGWLNAISNGFDGAEALLIVKEMEGRLKRAEKLAQLAYNTTSQLRDKVIPGKDLKKKEESLPGFTRASEMIRVPNSGSV